MNRLLVDYTFSLELIWISLLRSKPGKLLSFPTFPPLRGWWFLWLFVALCPLSPTAQTTLAPGDLAVISVNANNSFCSGFAGEDRISLVFFKDLTPGTTFDITDNGWERENAGFFGNQEGAFRFTRTGATIPAGTVVTLVLPTIGGQVRFSAPDNDWTLTRLSDQNNNVNLNSSGDQLIFMQGGIWDDGDTGFGGFLNNASYTGGRLLFAFNTRDSWTPFQDNSNDSGLPPAIGDCYNMTPATGSSDYLYYDGPDTLATQLEWIDRLSDPANWSTAVGCGGFPVSPNQIAFDNSAIGIECSVCQSCRPYQEDIRFSLPPNAGPYDLQFAVNRDTVQLTGYTVGTTYPVQVNDSAQITLLSIRDARGCAVEIRDTLRIELQVGKGISISPPPVQRACDQGGGTSGFNLIALGNNLRTSAEDTVIWYADSLRVQTLAPTGNFQSNSRTLYAEVQNGLCTSGLIPVALEVAPVPRLNALGDGFICPGECHEVVLQMRGLAPFTLQYELLIDGSWQPFFLRSESGDTTLRICPDFGRQATAIGFRSLSDQSCVTALSTTFDLLLYPPSVNLIRDTLCPEESLMVNGVLYDQQNPSGQDTLRGAGRNGCDSIIQVDLVYAQPSTMISIDAPGQVCRGESTQLTVRLPDDQGYTLTYQAGSGPPVTVNGAQGTLLIPVTPQTTTTYRLRRVEPEEEGCALDVDLTTTITVRDVMAQVNVIEPLRCAQPNSARLEAQASGGVEPYQYAWESGEQGHERRDLSAGNYSVTVTDAVGCQQTASIALEAPQPLQALIQEEPAICPGEEDRVVIQRISGGSGSYRYSLDGRSYTRIEQFPVVITAISPFTDRLFIDDGGGCTLEEPLVLINSTTVAAIDLGAERVIQQGDSVLLTASLNFNPMRLIWSNAATLRLASDSLSAVARPERTTIYRLTATTAGGCMLSQTVQVVVEERPQIYYAPNAFSPNNDGRNDYFTLYGKSSLQQIAVLRIYNRWGALVFEANDLPPNTEEAGWNGSAGSSRQPAGVYVYQAELVDQRGQRFRVSGSFTLLR